MIQKTISKLINKQNIGLQEVQRVMNIIMEGKATQAQIAAFLVGLKLKGESIEEITACAKIMREKSIKIFPKTKFLVDTCGTGGDNSNSFNISTASAFIVAGAGVSVAKHGNKSVSSRCGSADVLEALGTNFQLQPSQVKKCIEDIGIGFMFAPLFHPSMKHVMPARKEIGVRTIFNILGPLTNPANTKSQLIGVFDENILYNLAIVLKTLGTKHSIVVNGNGLDEISISGKTKICELKNQYIDSYYLDPKDYGFKVSPINGIKGGNPKENAKIILKILNGCNGPKKDVVLLNAGTAIYASDKTSSIKDGIEAAKYSLDSGAALNKLKDFKEYTIKNVEKNN